MPNSLNTEETDVMLVGAGPIGLEIAWQLKRNGLRYIHVEAGEIGATIGWYSPGTSIFSSPERISICQLPFQVYPNTKATREEYLTYLRSVVATLDLPVRCFTRLVGGAKRNDGKFECVIAPSPNGVGGPDYSEEQDAALSRGTLKAIVCSKLILAIGDMHLPNLLNIEGEKQNTVSHFLPEIHRLFRQRVILVGAKNSAAEAIVRLNRMEAKMTLIHRGDGFDPQRIKPWLLPEINSLIREGRIEFIPFAKLRSIEDEIAIVQDIRGQSPDKRIGFDRILLLTGYKQSARMFETFGVATDGDNGKPLLNADTLESNVPGLFVAGTAIAGTAIAGTQKNGVTVFIENCHSHSEKIVSAIMGVSRTSKDSIDRPISYREI